MAAHLAGTAGTCRQVDAGQREVLLLPRLLRWARGGGLAVDLQTAPGLCELRMDVTTGKQAVVAKLDEAVWQNVQEEATDELCRSHSGLLAVLSAEADAALIERNEPVVRDAHAVGVLAEIFED